MAVKTATITLEGDGLRFAARSGSGHSLVLDEAAADTGMRPAELIPMALAGCSAMDVIAILRKKRQAVTSYAVRAHGEQENAHPNAFTRIDVVHVLEGVDLDLEALRRAIELSATKYCSVGATLSSGIIEIHHAYAVRGPDGDEQLTEVVVTGPLEAPHSRGLRAVHSEAVPA